MCGFTRLIKRFDKNAKKMSNKNRISVGIYNNVLY